MIGIVLGAVGYAQGSRRLGAVAVVLEAALEQFAAIATDLRNGGGSTR